MRYEIKRTLCGRGSEPDRFMDSIRGICIGPENRLYAVGDSVLKIFDHGGVLLDSWKTSRPGYSVAATEEGVWVGGQSQIERFDPAGKALEPWVDEQLLGLVSSLAVSGDEIFAADAHARWIRRLDSEGRLINNIGDRHRKGGFHIPNGKVDFAMADDGSLKVANPGMHRVETYRPDGEQLGYFGRFDGNDPAGFPGCCNPTNVAIGPAGQIVVTEKAGPRVKVYDGDGAFLDVIASSETFDATAKNMDVALDADGCIYVTDPVRLTITVFTRVASEKGEAI